MTKTNYAEMMKFKDDNRRKMIEWKTQRAIPIEQWEELKTNANKNFSLQIMTDYLIKSTDGTVYVDRSEMIHSKEQEQQFYYLLKEDFIAIWKDIENLTVYFEVAEDEIISGAYNILTGEKVSKRILISSDTERAPYIYTTEDIEKFKEKICSATNASQKAK